MRYVRALLPSLVMLAVALVVIAVADTLFARERTELVDAYSAFVTLEWDLLAQYQADAERLLAEKDQEIIAIREQLAALLEQDFAAGDDSLEQQRRQLEQEIAAAYTEREQILRQQEQRARNPRTAADEVEPAIPDDSTRAAVDSLPAVTDPAQRIAQVRLQQLNREVMELLGQGDVAAADRTLATMRATIDRLPAPARFSLSLGVERQHALLRLFSDTLWSLDQARSTAAEMAGLAETFRQAEAASRDLPDIMRQVIDTLQAGRQPDPELRERITGNAELLGMTRELQEIVRGSGSGTIAIVDHAVPLGVVARGGAATGRIELLRVDRLRAGDSVAVGPPDINDPSMLCEAQVIGLQGTRASVVSGEDDCLLRSGDTVYEIVRQGGVLLP